MSQNLKDIIKSEYIKCSKDPVYFMRRFCKIQHPQRGKIKFDLYPFQEENIQDFKDNRFNIILKSRQLGISTISAGYSLWCMLFKTDFNILVIATKQTTAKNLVTKVRVMFDNLPSWLKVECTEKNKLGMAFANGSQIKAVSASEDAGRSEALSLLIVDEAAFIKNISEIWTSTQSTLSTGGSAIMLSTPNGMGNLFHETWVKAEEGDNDFHTIKLHWTVHPERDQVWRDEQTRQLGAKDAAQECDCSFISSGLNVIEGNTLQWYEQNQVSEPIDERGFDRNLWIFKQPDYSRQYVVVADVARGDGGDYSACHVIDIETVEQVAEYKGKIGTKEYGNFLVNLATEYNDALLVIENANIGWAVIQEAIDREYKNLFYSSTDLNYVDTEVQIRKGIDLKDKYSLKPGFTTTSRTRPLIIAKLEEYMREKTVIIHSKRLINELYTFVWKGSKAEAESGYNDDLTMAFSIALWVRDTALKLRQQGIDLTRQSLSNIKINTGMYNPRTNQLRDSGWSMKNGQGEDEDITWLR